MIGSRRRSSRRPSVRDERGLTLVELLVAMAILSIVMLVFTRTLASVQMAAVRQENLSRTNDQLRLVVEEMDRQIRSGQVLFDPASEGSSTCSGCVAGYTLRVYTMSNANAVSAGGLGYATCVLWKVASTSPYALKTVRWQSSDPNGTVTAWRTVATGVVNSQISGATAPFTLESGSRTLDLSFAVNQDLANRSTQTTYVQASLTGRNTAAGTPVTVCATVPTGL
jgi:prepilin-type N-terminal cleavage/methylation domain-containing protein